MSFSRSIYFKKILIGTKEAFTLFLEYIQKRNHQNYRDNITIFYSISEHIFTICNLQRLHTKPFFKHKNIKAKPFCLKALRIVQTTQVSIIISHTCQAMLKWDQKRKEFATVFYRSLDHFHSIAKINKA